jgi:hypothetical protein
MFPHIIQHGGNMKMVKTIGIYPLRDVVKYIICTGFVANCPYPTSLLVMAPPEHGKSTEVEKFESLGVIQVDKSTAYGLADIINGLTKRELEAYHHIVMLDLENYAASMKEVKQQLLAFMRQSSQEGIKRYHTARIDLNLDERKAFGFIMCTTPEDLGDKRSVFRSLSFLSRPLPFTYRYGKELRGKILDFIAEEEHNAPERYFLKAKEKTIVKLPKQYSDRLNSLALFLAKRIENAANHPKTVFEGDNRLCGIRAKENLMTLLKAIALYHERSVVGREDFAELLKLYGFMNFNFREIDESCDLKSSIYDAEEVN